MRLVLISFFVCVLFFGAPAFSKDMLKTYIIKVSGIKIGKLDWEISIEDKKYANKISLKSQGFLSAIYSFEGRYFSEGVIENESLKSKKYSHFWKTKNVEKKMELVFDQNKLLSLKQEPVEKEFLRLDIFGIKKTSDPLSSFLQIVMGANSSLVVDGRRLYTMNSVYNKEINRTKIQLLNYSNLWADHKRSKFEKIAYEKKDGDLFPTKIYIYFDGRVFRLEES